MSSLTVGQKIHNLRKKAGMSQLELETAIDASNGMISRIEADKTNPTKETLFAISQALKLNSAEEAYLLDVFHSDPTPADVAKVLASTSTKLDSENYYGYLIDNKSRVVEISKGFKNILHVHGVDTAPFYGKNVAYIFFDRSLGLSKILEESKREHMGKYLVAVLRQERAYLMDEPWWRQLLAELNNSSEFTSLWKEQEKGELDVYETSSRTVYLSLGGKEMPMLYSMITLHFDPRFRLIEYQFVNTSND